MKTYIETSRHIWRNVWLFDYIATVLGRVAAERENKMTTIAKESYKQILKQHQPYWLQKIANAAMIAVNSRPKFLKSFTDEQVKLQGKPFTEEEAYAEVQAMSNAARLLADSILLTVKKHQLDKLL